MESLNEAPGILPEYDRKNLDRLEHASDEEVDMERVNELKKIWVNKINEGSIELHEKTTDFARSLEKKYGRDFMINLKLYHVIIGSTVEPDLYHNFDTPSGEIEQFIRQEL
jgi:hypothetical protein